MPINRIVLNGAHGKAGVSLLFLLVPSSELRAQVIEFDVPAAVASQAFQFTVTSRQQGDTVGRPAGTWEITRQSTRSRDAAAVLSVSVFRGPDGVVQVIDSVVSLMKGAMPVSERSHQPGRFIQVDFAGTTVAAIIVRQDSAAQHWSGAFGAAPLNSTDTPLFAQCAATGVGAVRILPEFDLDLRQVVHDTVRVAAREVISVGQGTRSALRVESTTGPTIWSWWVDPDTRQLLRIERRNRGSQGRLVMELRQTR